MKLRPELMPPALKEELLAALLQLALELDRSSPEAMKIGVDQFNEVAHTALSLEEFEGFFQGEKEEWIRRTVSQPLIAPAENVSRSELVEVVRRAIPQNEFAEYEVYMEIFDRNVAMPGASNLIFYPQDYNDRTDTCEEYDPTPEDIVDVALSYQPILL